MVSGGVALFGGSVYNNVFDRHGTNYEKGLMLGYAGNSSIPSGLLTLSGEKPNSPMNVLLGVGQGYAIEEAERINGVGAMVSEIATPAIDTAVMEVATSPILIKGTGILIKGTAAASRVGRLGLHAPVRTAADNVLGQVDKVALERLQLGSRIEIPAGTTGIRKMMSDISVVTGNEVALVRDKFGTRWLAQGGPNELILPPNTVRVIAHTHPQGSLRLSGADLKAFSNPLRQNQRSTVLISPREDFGVRVPIPRTNRP
jgi:hypothetical protein